MSIVDTWDWDKIKLSEDSYEENVIRCECCNRKFTPFEYFVTKSRDNDEDLFMCENCFFDMALDNLGFTGVKMNHDGTDFYDPSDDDSEEPWDRELC